MNFKNHIVWLIYTVDFAISASLAFNIGTTAPHIKTTEENDYFRNKVLQFLSDDTKGKPTAHQLNGSEEHQNGLKQTLQCLIIPDVSFRDNPKPVKHFVLSAAEGSSHCEVFSSNVLPFNDNSKTKRVCYNMTDQQVSSFTNCFTEDNLELVFLFDGSASMTQAEFTKTKDFIVDIINRLKNSSIKFAAVQFSTDTRKVFDFNDYQAGTAFSKLKEEPHMKSLTHTHKALTFVLENILENPAAGASPDAIKVLVLITDGDPSDTDQRYQIIKRYDDKDIIRFVIAVKGAKPDKFIAIGSQPTETHVYSIGNYNGLANMKYHNFDTREEASDGRFERELSALFYNNLYPNSVCYQRTDQQVTSQTPPSQEYTQNTVDLVFLIDGSASMTEAEFNKNKDFIVNITNSLKTSSTKFATVQFSTNTRKVFDFNDYQDGTAFSKLKEERHMKGLTNTHKALTFVLENILESPAAGASPDAIKVLVLITDGDPSDIDQRYNIIKRYDDKDIIRFVIAVKGAKPDKFIAIGSQPTEKHVYSIENYNGLANMKYHNFDTRDEATGRRFQKEHRAVFDNNVYLNSVCYQRIDQQVTSQTPSSQEYTQKTVDLVFLFDGSASISEAEFNKNKDFIGNIINSIKTSSIKFAAVQFSTATRKVFDFNDYQDGTAFSKLKEEPHMKSLTHTHKALTFVLENILENPAAGASPDAIKVLVLITDGDPSDTDQRYQIIKRYDDKDIIRFVIAVSRGSMQRITPFASQQTQDYLFTVLGFDGLQEILEVVQKQIGCKISLTRRSSDKTSLSGISAIFHKDNLVLGSVKSNSWRDSLQNIQQPLRKQYPSTYIGNSICLGVKFHVPLFFTGAPQFKHKGKVVLFRQDCENWTPVQSLNGEQIGSYFGAELCSVDIDSDGDTDFLLVGAPNFNHYQDKIGQIYVYRLTDEMKLHTELNVTVSSMGRFGTTISSIADLNGDGLRDVAVGAPLEDESSGAVYIYLGDRHTGMRSTFSQRIIGRQIKEGLRYFGLAIDGDIDLGEDGLPDIVIGSQDTAVILRSRPIYNVLPQLSVQPEDIKTDQNGCLVNTDETVPALKLSVCFKMAEITKSKEGIGSTGLNISYTLQVDPTRHTHRGFFSQTDRKARSLTSTFILGHTELCFSCSIYLPECLEDTTSPISVSLTFFQGDKERASGVLSEDNRQQAVVEVPFHS